MLDIEILRLDWFRGPVYQDSPGRLSRRSHGCCLSVQILSMIHLSTLSTIDGAMLMYLTYPKDFFRYMDSVGRRFRFPLTTPVGLLCSLLSRGEVAFGSTAGATIRLLGPAWILLQGDVNFSEVLESTVRRDVKLPAAFSGQ